jgi:hypothetical protein
MKLTWYAPSGVEIPFTTDESAIYKFLLNYKGFSSAPVLHGTTNAPYQDGATCIDTKFQPRDISFDIMVQTPTLLDQQAAIQALVAAFNPIIGDGYLVFTKEDGSEYALYCRGRGNTVSLSTGIRSPTLQLVTIDLIAHDPFWYGSPPKLVYFDASTPLVFPFNFPFSLPRNDTTIPLWNYGNISTPVTITISGDIEDPVLHNQTTDKSMSINLNMVEGDLLVITTGFGNKTATYTAVSDGTPTNAFQYFDPDSEFWELQPLENMVELSYSSIGATGSVSIQWQDRYSGL